MAKAKVETEATAKAKGKRQKAKAKARCKGPKANDGWPMRGRSDDNDYHQDFNYYVRNPLSPFKEVKC